MVRDNLRYNSLVRVPLRGGGFVYLHLGYGASLNEGIYVEPAEGPPVLPALRRRLMEVPVTVFSDYVPVLSSEDDGSAPVAALRWRDGYRKGAI